MPTRFRQSFTLSRTLLMFSLGLCQIMWAPHLSGTDHYKGHVKFGSSACPLPRCGPNNKPLAFAVPGSHSCELIWVLIPSLHWFGCGAFAHTGSFSLFGRSFCSNGYKGEHPRQCESGAYGHYGSSSEKVSCSYLLTHNIVTNQLSRFFSFVKYMHETFRFSL